MTASDYLIFIFFNSVARLVLPKCISGPNVTRTLELGGACRGRCAHVIDASKELDPTREGRGWWEAGAGPHAGGGRGSRAKLGAPSPPPRPLFTAQVLIRAAAVWAPQRTSGLGRAARAFPEASPSTSGGARRGRLCHSRLRFPPVTARQRPEGATGPRGGRAVRRRGIVAAAATPEGHRPRARPPSSHSAAPPRPAASAAGCRGLRRPGKRGRGRSPRNPALRGLRLLCPWLPSDRGAVPPSTPSELHTQLSGVEQLLEEFRRLLQQERPQKERELELRAGGRLREEGCRGPCDGGYCATPDTIIHTKDSLAAGASFLSAPETVRDWRQCVAACCSEPRCSVAVVELPRRPASPAAVELGCCLCNCTARGRSVCKFGLHRGYSRCSLSRALEGRRGDLGASPRTGEHSAGGGRARPPGPAALAPVGWRPRGDPLGSKAK
ncbi:uncharacterized protein LOC123942086 [Meles meles]|uniref:uncharacterized protein LOC123942086 n=1 Tax=Meles meles TaxID=9662 RepID=UPI001E6A05C5|nr:uncharacterized protein LOC123942086 [Meles meles]